MKKILVILVSSFLLFSCNNKENNISSNNEENSQATEKISNTTENIFQKKYEVVLKENSGKTDVYVKNLEKNSEEKMITLSDVYTENYHNSEYINGKLYIIKRIGDIDTEDWNDELWMYNSDKKGIKLVQAKGLDFRVSPNGEKIAITSEGKVQIIDNSGNILSSFSSEKLGKTDDYSGIGFFRWSNDSKNFWGNIYIASEINNFFEINTDKNEVKIFDISDLSLGDDFDLNPNIGKIIYSDYPVFFDKESEDEFKKTNKKINLKVYNLYSEETENITTSEAKKFEPKWINNTTIEYNNLDGEGKIRKDI